MKPILEIQHISKKFLIGHEQLPYYSLRDKLANFFKSNSTKEDFWALKDVSFNVEKGESIGIIGRNGAGKSTLLKILSRITPPTTGKIITRGRIASLLEVGTGFHQELTGRENIFMNGSILGMKRSEIIDRFDEIVDFSGTEKFLDTPLKHYSSGMQLRLAFAVAAHLDPDILIIDEVLAVGDAEFQKKCLGKMNDVVKEGKTILFVSHNLSALQNLCSRAVLLVNGSVHSTGAVSEVIDTYILSSGHAVKEKTTFPEVRRSGTLGEIRFSSLVFDKAVLNFGQPISFRVSVQSRQKMSYAEINLAVAVNDKNGVCMIHASNEFTGSSFGFDGTRNEYDIIIRNNLRPGVYSLTLFLRAKGVTQDWIPDAANFIIEDGNPYGYSHTDAIQGQIFPEFSIVKK
jgi:lipopolysaccharide transport system ATP-binding protein